MKTDKTMLEEQLKQALNKKQYMIVPPRIKIVFGGNSKKSAILYKNLNAGSNNSPVPSCGKSKIHLDAFL